MRHFKVLIIILFFGFLLRVINITDNSLYGDELTIVYDVYSILKTGHDSLGNFLPLTFPMGAGRPAGYVYFSIPFVALFGPTELGVRALSILSGMGIIFLLFLIGKRLFSEKVGLVAAAFVAISPWNIALSRGGFEAHFALLLTILASYLFILAKAKPVLFIIAALTYGLAIHTYPTYKLILPLFLPLLIWYKNYYQDLFDLKSRFYVVITIMILVIFMLLSLIQTLTGGSEARFLNINIFSQNQLQESIIQKINFERSISELPQSVFRYFHNKPVEYSKVLTENYLQNFSLDFLILHGDRNPRHNMSTMGEIYFADVIFLFFGLVFLWQKERKTLTLLLIWLLIASFPSAIISSPHALRNSFMLPPLILISAYGLVSLLSSRGRIFLVIIGIIFATQFIFFTQKLYFLSPNEYGNFWAYSAKLASEITKLEKGKFDYIFLSDGIDNVEFAYPVYAKIEPSLVIGQNQKKEELVGYQFKKFDNVYIGYLPDGEIENFILNLNGSVLYIGVVQKRDILIDHDIIRGRDNMPALLVIRKI